MRQCLPSPVPLQPKLQPTPLTSAATRFADSIRQSHWFNLLPFPDAPALQTLAAPVAAPPRSPNIIPKTGPGMRPTVFLCQPLLSAQGNTVFVPILVRSARPGRAITRPSQEISIHISSIRSDLNIWGDIWNDEPTCRISTA